MKNILFSTIALFSFSMLNAQTDTGALSGHHRIVFQLSSGDTMAHKALMKQLKNITSVAPETEIEVVCHGPGLNMLVADKTVVRNSIQNIISDKITFLACEFSMKERNVAKESIIPEAGFVKAGIIEIVIKQEQGWSYIKSGF